MGVVSAGDCGCSAGDCGCSASGCGCSAGFCDTIGCCSVVLVGCFALSADSGATDCVGFGGSTTTVSEDFTSTVSSFGVGFSGSDASLAASITAADAGFCDSWTGGMLAGVVGGVGEVTVGVSGVTCAWFEMSLDRSSFSNCLTGGSISSDSTGGVMVEDFFNADFNGFGSSLCTISGAEGFGATTTGSATATTSGVTPRVSLIFAHMLVKLSLPK